MGDDFDKYESLLTGDDPFLVTGMVRIDKDEDRTRISVRIGRGRRRGPQHFSDDEPDVVSLHEIRATKTRIVEISTLAGEATEPRLQRLLNTLESPKHEGNTEIRLRLTTDTEAGDCDVILKVSKRISPSDELHQEIKRAFDGACTLSVTA